MEFSCFAVGEFGGYMAPKLSQRLIQRLTKVLVVLMLTLSIPSCSKEEHVVITLPNTHLEETQAGFWLRVFEIDYSPGAESLKRQILEKLKSNGTLVDGYFHEEGANEVKTSIWKYEDLKIKLEYYRGGIWKGPKIVPFQEYYRGGLNSWISVDFSEGIPYSRLLPDHHKKINPNRKYEHTATIESTIDQERRLFLFGYGTQCQRISLF